MLQGKVGRSACTTNTLQINLSRRQISDACHLDLFNFFVKPSVSLYPPGRAGSARHQLIHLHTGKVLMLPSAVQAGLTFPAHVACLLKSWRGVSIAELWLAAGESVCQPGAGGGFWVPS